MNEEKKKENYYSIKKPQICLHKTTTTEKKEIAILPTKLN